MQYSGVCAKLLTANLRGVQCRGQPEPALYNGGILKFGNSEDPDGYRTTETGVFSPAFVVYNLSKTTMYTFSCELALETGPACPSLPFNSSHVTDYVMSEADC